MPRRHQAVSLLDQAQLLRALGVCWRACSRAEPALRPDSVAHHANKQLLKAIDDLAELLTGDRAYFTPKPPQR